MKKNTSIVILVCLFAAILIGCEKEQYTYSQTEFDADVVSCEESTFHPNTTYITLANMYLGQNNYALWSMYMTLANATGQYDYNVTVDIDGNNYTVIRSQQYQIGQKVRVIKIETYKINSDQLISISYK